jgi:hypothetical protein
MEKDYEEEIANLKGQLEQSEIVDKEDEESKKEKEKSYQDLLEEKSQVSDRLSKTLDEYNELAARNEKLVESISKIKKEKEELEGKD